MLDKAREEINKPREAFRQTYLEGHVYKNKFKNLNRTRKLKCSFR
jgi:hypothetical protein